MSDKIAEADYIEDQKVKAANRKFVETLWAKHFFILKSLGAKQPTRGGRINA